MAARPVHQPPVRRVKGAAAWGLALALVCGLGAGLGGSTPAWAGKQAEEPLANAVRTALSAAVANQAPPVPVFAGPAQRQKFEEWVAKAEQRLLKREPNEMVRRELLQTIWYEAKRARLEPNLVLGLIEVESGFRQHAISVAGARGLMQVMPFWARLIGTGDAGVLFNKQANIRFGCVILSHYLEIEKGNMFLALGRYNGSRGRAEYPNLVNAAWNRWERHLQTSQLAQAAGGALSR